MCTALSQLVSFQFLHGTPKCRALLNVAKRTRTVIVQKCCPNPSLFYTSCLAATWSSMEDNYAALSCVLTSHQSAQAASANGGPSKWATQVEIHSKETSGADSSKESLLWSKFTVITSPLSSDAVSFFGNIGKSWAQQKTKCGSLISFKTGCNGGMGSTQAVFALVV